MFRVGDRVKNIFTKEVGVVVRVNTSDHPYTVEYKHPEKYPAPPTPQKRAWLEFID